MVYLITYCKNNEVIAIEWVAPSNFSQAAIRQAFYCQYSGAEIISIEAIGEGCLVGSVPGTAQG